MIFSINLLLIKLKDFKFDTTLAIRSSIKKILGDDLNGAIKEI